MPADLIPLCDKEPPFFFFLAGESAPHRRTRCRRGSVATFLPSFLFVSVLLSSPPNVSNVRPPAVKLGAPDTKKNKKSAWWARHQHPPLFFSPAASYERLWAEKHTQTLWRKKSGRGKFVGGKTRISVAFCYTCAAEIYLHGGSFSLMSQMPEN